MEFKDDFVEHLDKETKLPIATLEEQNKQLKMIKDLEKDNEKLEEKYLKSRTLAADRAIEIIQLRRHLQEVDNERRIAEKRLSNGLWFIGVLSTALAVSTIIYKFQRNPWNLIRKDTMDSNFWV